MKKKYDNSKLFFDFLSADKLYLTLNDLRTLDKFINLTKLDDKISFELLTFMNQLICQYLKENNLKFNVKERLVSNNVINST